MPELIICKIQCWTSIISFLALIMVCLSANPIFSPSVGGDERDQFERGLSYYAAGDFESALRELNACIKKSPSASACFHARGNVFYELKDYRRAIADYNVAIKIRNDDASAYSNRAWSYAKIGRMEKASLDFQTCRALLDCAPND